MAKISHFDLITAANVYVDGIGTFRQPTLNDILTLGYDTYSAYINMLFIDLDSYLEHIETTIPITEEIKSELTIFDMWFYEDKGRALLKEALSFFIKGDIEQDKTAGVLNVYENFKKVGSINRTNYEEVQSIIKEFAFIHTSPKPKKFKNKAAKRIYEQIHKTNGEKAKNDSTDMDLSNIIASVSASHNSYNLLNILGLTVYQVYDQFFRLSNKIQIDAMSLKWAAWGTEPFDFSSWYKNLDFKNQ